jgi:hypothetical protein
MTDRAKRKTELKGGEGWETVVCLIVSLDTPLCYAARASARYNKANNRMVTSGRCATPFGRHQDGVGEHRRCPFWRAPQQ